jgi:hypothetical protein
MNGENQPRQQGDTYMSISVIPETESPSGSLMQAGRASDQAELLQSFQGVSNARKWYISDA